MKGNRSNHLSISGDKDVGDRIRAYSESSGKKEYEIAEEMSLNPAVYKATVRQWLVKGNNPRGINVGRVNEYLTRMGWK